MDQNRDCAERERFQAVCRYIEAHRDETLPLTRLGALVHLSPAHFQRRFKAVVGISPKQYQEACRLNQLKQVLRMGSSVTEAVYEAGFSSASRLYEKLDTCLGMTPNQYRRGGKGLAISYACAATCLGLVMMAATDRGLCFIQFGEHESELLERLRKEYPQAELLPMTDIQLEQSDTSQFQAWMQALNAHLQGEMPDLDLPLDIQGTAFQLKVWRYLQQIPYGQVQSYTQVAEGIGQPKAARAVASACAANRLAIVVPCHRVIRGSGDLAGYRWGLERKRDLIERERQFRGSPVTH